MENFITYIVPIFILLLAMLLIIFIPKSIKFFKKLKEKKIDINATKLMSEAQRYLSTHPEFEREIKETVKDYINKANKNSKGTK